MGCLSVLGVFIILMICLHGLIIPVLVGIGALITRTLLTIGRWFGKR